MNRFRAKLVAVVCLALAACGDQSKDKIKSADGGPKEEIELETDENGMRRPKGFVVQKVLSVPFRQNGSWISIAFGEKGNLFVGTENGPLNILRLSNDGKVEGIEVVKGVPGKVHGILEAFKSLYVASHEKKALVRCRDENGDGVYEKQESILSLEEKGEYGPYDLTLTENGEGIYLSGGHKSPVPINAAFPTLPAPGGWIVRIPPDASKVRVIASGLRNADSIIMNANGDIFTCDSDAIEDIGLPWYRPPRLLQIVSGADFGWREGPEKWPNHYADSLPGITSLGPSLPTGMASGHLTHFPMRYRDSVFVLDKTFGAIHNVRLISKDASYLAASALFLIGENLRFTDAAVAPNGSLYVISAEKNSPSTLYRISHETPSENKFGEAPSNRVRDQRLRLETFHTAPPSDIARREAWSGLKSPDRFVRHAARITLERQPTKGWQSLFEDETNNRAAINAALALARKAPAHRRASLAKLANLNFGSLLEENKLAFLRAFNIAVEFKPEPPPELLAIIVPQLDAAYPSGNDILDQELARVLGPVVSGDSTSSFIDKTLRLLESRNLRHPSVNQLLFKNNPVQARNYFHSTDVPPDPIGIHLAFVVSHIDAQNWNSTQMQKLYRWLNRSALNAPQGTNYQEVLIRLTRSVFGALPPELRQKLSPPPSPSP